MASKHTLFVSAPRYHFAEICAAVLRAAEVGSTARAYLDAAALAARFSELDGTDLPPGFKERLMDLTLAADQVQTELDKLANEIGCLDFSTGDPEPTVWARHMLKALELKSAVGSRWDNRFGLFSSRGAAELKRLGEEWNEWCDREDRGEPQPPPESEEVRAQAERDARRWHERIWQIAWRLTTRPLHRFG